MTLQLGPESSALARAAAASILVLHIGGGAVGLLSGAAAMAFPKGSQPHRLAGQVFVGSMLLMSAIGAAVSPFLPRPQWTNVVVGVFTFYLVATAWATAQRSQGAGPLEVSGFLVAASVAVGSLALGLLAIQHRELTRGSPSGVPFVLAAGAALAAAGDLRLLLRGDLSGRKRMVRHLWRMCVALFIAAGSLFLGQPNVFPASLRGSPILFLPELAVLGLLVFWLVRVRVGRRAYAVTPPS
jgi:hypothetical protein